MATHIAIDTWETLALDREQWRQATHKGKSHIEETIDHNLRNGFPYAFSLSSSVSTAGEALQVKLIGLITNRSTTSKAHG